MNLDYHFFNVWMRLLSFQTAVQFLGSSSSRNTTSVKCKLKLNAVLQIL